MDLRERIAGARQPEPVECPEWSVTLSVRRISALERARYEVWCSRDAKMAGQDEGERNARRAARLVIVTAVTETGKPAFADADLEALVNTPDGATVVRLWERAATLNGMTAAAQEEIRKNSESGASTAPPTGSP
jgi:hypothetical protein